MDEIVETMDRDFDWVTARLRCSLVFVFEKLKAGVERDVKTRDEAARTENRAYRYGAERDNIWVSLAGQSLQHTVRFGLTAREIVVTLDDRELLKGSVTVCDDGECRIRVDDKPLELWQFRRRALERLFFEY